MSSSCFTLPPKTVPSHLAYPLRGIHLGKIRCTPKAVPSRANAIYLQRLWHGSGDRVTVQFHGSHQSFQVPEPALNASFDYFKIKSEANFSGQGGKSVKLPEGTHPNHFEVLLTWLQTGLLKMPCDSVSAIGMCISTIIDAAQLQMVNFENYIAVVEGYLRKILPDNRMALSHDHLFVMQQHSNLFQTEATPVKAILARAAVRPFLSSHIAVTEKESVDARLANWKQVISHYEDLMENDIQYTKDVMTEVRETLRTCKRSNNVGLRAKARFCENNIHYDWFDIVIYPDPLLTRAGSDVRMSYFTI